MALTIFDRTQSSKKGTATNDNAAAGEVGEYKSADFGNMPFTANDTAQDIVTLELTPGDWMVSGTSVFDGNGSNWSQVILNVLLVPGNSFTGNVRGVNAADCTKGASSVNTPSSVVLTTPMIRFSVAVNTTLYLKRAWSGAFSGGTPTNSFSRIQAWRIR